MLLGAAERREGPLVPTPGLEIGRVRRSVYLHPGQLVASRTPAAVSTVLGSCVAVCAWDPSSGIGGMNHFLLAAPLLGRDPLRSGESATRALLAELVALGARESFLVAKMFGGASVLAPVEGGTTPLGLENVSAARRALSAAGIEVVAEDVGGTWGRKVVFHTDDGSARVRRL
jgi:chemotaxis protein CheD